MKHTCGFQTGYLVCPACNAGAPFVKEELTYHDDRTPYHAGSADLAALDPKEFDRTSPEKDLDLVKYWAGKGFPDNFKFLDYPQLMNPPTSEESLKTLFSGWDSIAHEELRTAAFVRPSTASAPMNSVLCPCGCGGQISEEQARSIRNAATEPKEIDRLRKLLAEERERADRAEDELSALKRQLRM